MIILSNIYGGFQLEFVASSKVWMTSGIEVMIHKIEKAFGVELENKWDFILFNIDIKLKKIWQ